MASPHLIIMEKSHARSAILADLVHLIDETFAQDIAAVSAHCRLIRNFLQEFFESIFEGIYTDVMHFSGVTR